MPSSAFHVISLLTMLRLQMDLQVIMSCPLSFNTSDNFHFAAFRLQSNQKQPIYLGAP